MLLLKNNLNFSYPNILLLVQMHETIDENGINSHKNIYLIFNFEYYTMKAKF